MVANPVQKVLKGGRKRLNEIAPNASSFYPCCCVYFPSSLFFGVGKEKAPKKLSDPKKCAQSPLAHLLHILHVEEFPYAYFAPSPHYMRFPGENNAGNSFIFRTGLWLPSCNCGESYVRTVGDSSPGGGVKIEF